MSCLIYLEVTKLKMLGQTVEVLGAKFVTMVNCSGKRIDSRVVDCLLFSKTIVFAVICTKNLLGCIDFQNNVVR